MEEDIEEKNDNNPNKINVENNENVNNAQISNVLTQYDSLMENNKLNNVKIAVKRKRGAKFGDFMIEGLKNKKKKRETSDMQKFLNVLLKNNVKDADVVKYEADKMNLQLTQDQLGFFSELAKAKVIYKKVGIPGNLCKRNMHLRFLLPLDNGFDVKIITDDKIFWYCVANKYLLTMNELVTLTDIKGNIGYRIKKISVCSKTLKEFKEIKEGYCQDYYPNKTYVTISDFKDVDDAGIEGMVSKIKPIDSIIEGKKFYMYINDKFVVVDDDNDIKKIVKNLRNIKLVNGKNKLKNGVKIITNKNKDVCFYNIHDIKLNNFVPSVVYTGESLFSCVILIDSELNSDMVLKKMDGKVKTLRELYVFFNTVFWDNIDSFMELLLIFATCYECTDELKKEIIDAFTQFKELRSVFSLWKQCYNLFEHIVMSLYDSITTKISMDQVLKYDALCDKFLNLYKTLFEHESFKLVGDLISKIQKNAALMVNFISNEYPVNVIYAIKKLVLFIKTGTKIQDITFKDLVHSVGILCLNVMFNGSSPIIPKIRSRCSYLGNASGEITDQTVLAVLAKVTKKFNEEGKIKKQEEDEYRNAMKEAQKYFKTILVNTLNKYKNGLYTNVSELVYDAIKNNKFVVDSLLDDISVWMLDEEFEDYFKDNKLNFLGNPYFVKWITILDKTLEVLGRYYTEYENNISKIGKTIEVSGNIQDKPAPTIEEVAKIKTPDLKSIENIRGKITPAYFMFDKNIGRSKKNLKVDDVVAIIDEIVKTANNMY